MKKRFHIQFLATLIGGVLGLLILSNCTTFNKSQASDNAHQQRQDPATNKDLVLPNEEHPTTLGWADLFRQVPAVSVKGQGNNLSIRIRGASSLNLTTEPLFVLEGVPLGHQFSSLASATNPQDVKSIYVLKGPEATIYGSRGSNGVVVVTLRSFEN